MKNLSKRKFVLCFSADQEVPLEKGEQCCEFYNDETEKCEYKKYASHKHYRLSEREEIYREFTGEEETKEY